LTTLADVTNDLFMPCHKQRTGAATVATLFSVAKLSNYKLDSVDS